MKPLKVDPCVYVARRQNKIMLITILVDDLIIACNDSKWAEDLKNHSYQKIFEMRYLGNVNYALGIEFLQEKGRITMLQKKYVKAVLERFGMQDCNPIL